MSMNPTVMAETAPGTMDPPRTRGLGQINRNLEGGSHSMPGVRETREYPGRVTQVRLHEAVVLEQK